METKEITPIAEDYVENGDGGGYTVVDEDHIIVKAEFMDNDDFDDDIADPEQNDDYNYGYYPGNPGEGDATLYMQGLYDDPTSETDGGKYVRDMVEGTPEQQENRKIARQENMRVRKDCPVCGDRVNGIHYGIFTCEGCKNFFKRSMSIKKPYICIDRGNCDVGVYMDASGIKRKGTRCQACRFLACLDTGMIHQGHNRSTGRLRRTRKDKTESPTPVSKRAKLSNSVSYSNDVSLSDSLNSSATESKEGIVEGEASHSILEQMLETPALEFKPRAPNPIQTLQNTVKAPVQILPKPAQSLPNPAPVATDPFNQLEKEQYEATINLLRDQLQYERNKNSEYERQLSVKQDKIKVLENQVINYEKHISSVNNRVVNQKHEIVRLQQEVKQLGVFRNIITPKNQQTNGGNIADFAHQQNWGFPSSENIAAYDEEPSAGVDPLNLVSVVSLTDEEFLKIKREQQQ